MVASIHSSFIVALSGRCRTNQKYWVYSIIQSYHVRLTKDRKIISNSWATGNVNDTNCHTSGSAYNGGTSGLVGVSGHYQELLRRGQAGHRQPKRWRPGRECHQRVYHELLHHGQRDEHGGKPSFLGGDTILRGLLFFP
jgi:hypothetical protein